MTTLAAAAIDDRTAAEVVDLLNDARRRDAPHLPPTSLLSYKRSVRHGWDGRGPEQLWLAQESKGLAGYAEMWLPHWDNQHIAFVEVVVHPKHRRRGVATALLAQVDSAVKSAGRTLELVDTWVGGPGELFVGGRGFSQAQVNAQRRLHLTDLDVERLDQIYAESSAAAQAYELVPIVGAAPEDMLDSLVDLFASINDAPLDDLEAEDEVFSRERLRCFDEAQTAMGQRMYRLLARRVDDASWAGHTILTIDPSRPTWGAQSDTSVLTTHRGHRLGLLLKTAMLRWLREAEPQLEQIDTWNSTSNAHMIAVNDMLGCVVVGESSSWQKRL